MHKEPAGRGGAGEILRAACLPVGSGRVPRLPLASVARVPLASQPRARLLVPMPCASPPPIPHGLGWLDSASR